MGNQLFLSIIIPVYNGENYITECLNSCLEQDLDSDKYEILVIDDGSTDNSVNIIEDYIKKHNNIYFIKTQHQGVSVARNTGIMSAKGQYIWFIDCDDLIKPNCLNDLYINFRDGKYDKIKFKGYIFNDTETADFVLPKSIDGKNIISYWGYPWIVIQKKEICLQNGVFFNKDIALGEDELFHIDYNICLKTKIYEFDKILYYYRQHNAQVMNGASRKPLFRSMEIMKGVKYLTEKLKTDERYCVVIDFVLRRLDYALRLLVDEENRAEVKYNLKAYKKMDVLPCKILYNYVDNYKVPTKRKYNEYYVLKYGRKGGKLKDRLKHPLRSVVNLFKKLKRK